MSSPLLVCVVMAFVAHFRLAQSVPRLNCEIWPKGGRVMFLVDTAYAAYLTEPNDAQKQAANKVFRLFSPVSKWLMEKTDSNRIRRETITDTDDKLILDNDPYDIKFKFVAAGMNRPKSYDKKVWEEPGPNTKWPSKVYNARQSLAKFIIQYLADFVSNLEIPDTAFGLQLAEMLDKVFDDELDKMDVEDIKDRLAVFMVSTFLKCNAQDVEELKQKMTKYIDKFNAMFVLVVLNASSTEETCAATMKKDSTIANNMMVLQESEIGRFDEALCVKFPKCQCQRSVNAHNWIFNEELSKAQCLSTVSYKSEKGLPCEFCPNLQVKTVGDERECEKSCYDRAVWQNWDTGSACQGGVCKKQMMDRRRPQKLHNDVTNQFCIDTESKDCQNTDCTAPTKPITQPPEVSTVETEPPQRAVTDHGKMPTWQWILIGTSIALVVLTAFVVILCCIVRKKKNKRLVREREYGSQSQSTALSGGSRSRTVAPRSRQERSGTHQSGGRRKPTPSQRRKR